MAPGRYTSPEVPVYSYQITVTASEKILRLLWVLRAAGPRRGIRYFPAVLSTGKREQLHWAFSIHVSKRLAEFSAVPTGLYLLFIVGAVKSEDLAVTLTEERSRLAKHGIEKVKQASHYAQAHLLTRWQEAMNIAMG